jgi:vitamin B12/bleomycin/antimicrobial peptide transport system ATP-binding/permease protein
MRGAPFVRPAWQLILGYWRSEERWRARLLLAVIVGLTLGLVGLLVILNDWQREFYEALQNHDFAAFGPLLLRFTLLATLFIVGSVYKLYFTQMLEMRWRAWLTRRFLGDWLGRQAYYRLALENRATDNPDQRIAEDLRLFTSATLGLSLGLLTSVVTLVSFSVILWSISGPLDFTVGGTEISIPAYMLWAALIYALLGSLATRYVGQPLIGLNFQQQRYEADFRFGLVRVRENAEGIALYRGEEAERVGLLDRFERVRLNWWELMRYTKRLTFLTVGYAQLAVIFPIIVAAPRYFSGAISLGVLVQISNAFAQVEGSLSWFVDNYGALASWKASTDRLLTFQLGVALARAEAERTQRVEVVADSVDGLRAEGVELQLPNGQPLLAEASFGIESGDQVLLTGPNGSGKSTLFRAIAGIWPFGRGRIHVPGRARMLFLPQRPYLPIASLRDAVTYPAPPGSFGDEAVGSALGAVGLERFIDRLDESENWSLQMSGGEQQRLAFARVLLHRPDWLFLDEATAALDQAGERQIYGQLREQLPDATVVSVAHRAAFDGVERTRLELTRSPDGAPSQLVVSRDESPASA